MTLFELRIGLRTLRRSLAPERIVIEPDATGKGLLALWSEGAIFFELPSDDSRDAETLATAMRKCA
jgi:hypothetical protein